GRVSLVQSATYLILRYVATSSARRGSGGFPRVSADPERVRYDRGFCDRTRVGYYYSPHIMCGEGRGCLWPALVPAESFAGYEIYAGTGSTGYRLDPAVVPHVR